VLLRREIRACARALAVLAALVAAASGCGRRNAARVPRAPAPPVPAAAAPLPAPVGAVETGLASWYGEPYHGRRSASGEVYDMERLTAAHRTLPFETWVEVTNLGNQRRVEVRITDRGPFVEGRIIDLSLAAARALDMVRDGVVPVRLRVIDPPVPPPEPPPAAPAGGYAVQAGAFSDRNRAEAFRDSLPFADARVVSAGQAALWRVLVGRGLNMDAAARLAQQVRETASDAFIVLDR
jgi:rare lipoprotein A